MRRALLLAASLLSLASCGSPVLAANLTPDQLTAATTANNTDLFLIYPAGGPMRSLQWSVVKALMAAQLGTTYLQVANNLSDLGSPTAARTSLGLGTAALQNTGTSGANIPLLNTSNTWGALQTLTGGLSLSSAFPASTMNDTSATVTTGGLVRFTTAGSGLWQYQINTAVAGDFSTVLAPYTISPAGLVTMNNGLTVAGAITGNLTGNASGNAGTATTLATGRTIAATGDVSYTSPTFNGSANVTAAATLATVNGSPGSCTQCALTVNGKGLVTAQSNGTPGLTAYANVTCTGSSCTVAAGSVNVTSVTRNSAGNYTVNFTATYPDTHYVCALGSGIAIFMSVTSMANGSVTVAFTSATDGQFFIQVAGT